MSWFRKLNNSWITPDAVFCVMAFLAVSYLFSLYLRFAPAYDITYGSLGAVIVLMLWLYVAGLIVLIGGEVNSELDKAVGKRRVERGQTELQQAR